METNKNSLDTLCAALCDVLGIEPPREAAKASEELTAYAAEAFSGRKADRIFMYNPDAIAQWVYEKYPAFLAEAKSNSRTFATFSEMIKTHWTGHDTLVGFAMDHGCHEIDGGCGSHGLDMPEDLNIVHFYKAYPKL